MSNIAAQEETRANLLRSMAELTLKLGQLDSQTEVDSDVATMVVVATPPVAGLDEDDQSTKTSKKRSTPSMYSDLINKAARTILDHDKFYRIWTATDFADNAEVSAKLLGNNHYITQSAKFGFLKTLA